ncbi:serine protease inhibitor swm-1-like isoform X1 [Arctopsyche grandis]
MHITFKMMATRLLLICFLFYTLDGCLSIIIREQREPREPREPLEPLERFCGGPNELFSRCRGHCDTICNAFSFCNPRSCIPGCVCARGFYRHPKTWKCVTKNECLVDPTPTPTPTTTPTPTVSPPQECGDNEHYTDCGTACPQTCENYKRPPMPCISVCVPGCFCNQGFVRNTNTGQCVPPSSCYNEFRDSEIPK